MLDDDDPQAPHICAASQQLGLILDYCKRITLSENDSRLFMLKVIQPAFAALHWLNTSQFGPSATITTSLDELKCQIEALSQLNAIPDKNNLDDPTSTCPVCGGQPNTPSQYDASFYCPECLETVMPAYIRLESCEEGFGTEAI